MCKCNKTGMQIVNTAAQAVTAGASIVFGQIQNQYGCSVAYTAGSGPVKILKPGKYLVTLNADIAPTADEAVTIQLLKNGLVIPGAEATATPAAAGATVNLNTTTLINVLARCPYIDSPANITATVSVAGNVTNIDLIVVQI